MVRLQTPWIRRTALVLLALVWAGAAGPAAAWSDLGHRVVADLAYARLTPEAKAQVDALIAQAPAAGEPSCPVASLADASVFPDCVDGIRKYNELRRLHEQAEPFCPAQARGDPCKDGQCVSAALKRALGVLSDPAAPPAAKLYALEQAAHFMADLHQPLDMIDNRDDHGREIRVVLPGSSDRRLNLHDFWNDQVVALAVGSEDLGERWLQPVADAGQRWDEGGVDAWADETVALARSLYQRLPEPPTCGRNPRNPEMLDRSYVMATVPVAREQLAKAAVRLASVLNTAMR
ncbi:MAG TPA: S1/P1 nuclease [Caulobacteraceae bacterium]|nr:S1/P1 nuclease [Caulobacteraceae bacterium]